MKSSIGIKILGALAAAVGIMGSMNPAIASTFGKREVNADDFITVAAPRGLTGSYYLMILEQQSNTRPCWSTTGTAPIEVNPLLLNFDFSGICGRSLDSNGYSIRMADEDLGLRYSLRVVDRNGDLVLVGVPNRGNTGEIEIGRTFGISGTNFSGIQLNPGWRLTKRTFEGRTLGHVYLTNDLTLAQYLGNPVTPPTPPDPEPTLSFPDIAGDIYVDEINQAVTLGFISGFAEDNTFRPRATLTREQLVSIVVEALRTQPNSRVVLPTQVSSNPYPDVAAGRWSAAKIQFARDNNIISGYLDGSFRPTQAVTRAELMAILRRTAEFGKQAEGLSPTLTPTQTATAFADTSGHWAEALITNMSAYCGIASPLNEIGTSFAPDQSARRNYAAAGSVRMLECLAKEGDS